MSGARQARDEIKVAIDKHHNGVYAVAAASGVHFTQVYAFLRGKGLSEPNAGKLRSVLTSVSAETWADAFAPMPETEPADATA